MLRERTKKTIKGIKGVGFEFVEDGHAYYLDGKKLTGVTTILGVIAKPMLIGWAANMACDYIENKWKSSEVTSVEATQLFEWIKEARTAHTKKKVDAGSKGKEVHAIIENLIKIAIYQTKGVIQLEDVSGAVRLNDQVRHFVAWATENKVKFIASEEKVFSRELFVGGTIDFICEIDGETWIGDIKTSSAIYPEHFFQTAGYQKLLADMAETDGGMRLNVKGHLILNLRKDGSFEEKRSISNEDNLLAFMSAYNLYKISEKLKGTII